jgi:hypothetical protein
MRRGVCLLSPHVSAEVDDALLNNAHVKKLLLERGVLAVLEEESPAEIAAAAAILNADPEVARTADLLRDADVGDSRVSLGSIVDILEPKWNAAQKIEVSSYHLIDRDWCLFSNYQRIRGLARSEKPWILLGYFTRGGLSRTDFESVQGDFRSGD